MNCLCHWIEVARRARTGPEDDIRLTPRRPPDEEEAEVPEHKRMRADASPDDDAAAICPVCLEATESVTKPCRHSLCQPCSDMMLEHACRRDKKRRPKLQCPICRQAIESVCVAMERAQ